MIQWIKNVLVLTYKEVKSLLSDVVMVVLMLYLFTAGVVVAAKGVTTDVYNAPTAVIDHDQSELSRSIISAVREPYFQQPESITDTAEQHSMDIGQYVFVLDIPVNFEKDFLMGKSPEIFLNVDATAMTLASSGTSYISKIINKELTAKKEVSSFSVMKPVVNTLFNSNTSSVWSMALSQIIGDISLLTLIVTGAAVIRERERGTIEHLLVMPVSASEIAMAKLLANSLIIFVITMISMFFVVHMILGVPIAGSLILFAIGLIFYLFSFASLGMMLSIMAPTMPQFGLLCLPVYIVLDLLSGAISPIENMPLELQKFMQCSPTMQFAAFAQDVVFRGAGIDIVYPRLIIMGIIGGLFLLLALYRFRSMLSKQG